MIPRVVCDTMVLFQWAAIRRERLHGMHTAALTGRIRLCISTELLTEIRDLLARPAIRGKAPHLTDQRVALFLDTLLAAADFFADPPRVFTLPHHPKDDHVFNLAIGSCADRIATWEQRLLRLDHPDSTDGQRLRALNPQLRIITPAALMDDLKLD